MCLNSDEISFTPQKQGRGGEGRRRSALSSIS